MAGPPIPPVDRGHADVNLPDGFALPVIKLIKAGLLLVVVLVPVLNVE